jgi:hypothetical protein
LRRSAIIYGAKQEVNKKPGSAPRPTAFCVPAFCSFPEFFASTLAFGQWHVLCKPAPKPSAIRNLRLARREATVAIDLPNKGVALGSQSRNKAHLIAWLNLGNYET